MEILPVKQVQDNQVDLLITQAIDKNVSVETLERLLIMREKWKAQQAKEAYFISMAEFQNECPIIKKTKKVYNKQGVFLYPYAPIESIIYQVRPLIYKHGFSYAMITVPDTEYGIVSCIIRHIEGHEIIHPPVKYPLGERTNIMSATQHYAAALTYAKRYAFCDAFGIMTGNIDTDSRAVVQKESTEDIQEYIKIIRKLLLQTTHTEKDILQEALVDKLEDLGPYHLRKVINYLQSIIDNKDK